MVAYKIIPLSSQPQRIPHDQQAAGRHRGSRNHGADDAEGCQRHGDQVVGEGPAEVFEDDPLRAPRKRDKPRDGGEVRVGEHHVRGFPGDVGAARCREAQVGLGQREGVVDAIACHRAAFALGLPRLDALRFLR